MCADGSDREVQILRVSVQEILYKKLRDTNVALAETRQRLISAEAALDAALRHDSQPGVDHIEHFAQAIAKEARIRKGRLGPKGSRGYKRDLSR